MISPLSLAKDRLTITEAWSRCGLPGQPKVGMNQSPFRKDSNPSFSIYAEGKRWKDFGTGESGSVVDFVAKAQGLSNTDACTAVIRLAGTEATITGSTVAPVKKPAPAPAPWSSVEAVWEEGRLWLAGNQETKERMALWRGWPVHWIDALIEDGHLACPIYQGGRGTAFLVLRPAGEEAVPVGFHFRNKDGGWRFAPKGIKAYPFILGSLHSPRLIILEGQWDAITLAGSAGWLDRHEAWPEDVAVVGIRGANGTGAFMEAVAEIMQKNRPKVLIIRDGDEAGAIWKSVFAPKLKELAGSVRLFRLAEAKDLNDSHRNQPLTSDDVWAILGEMK